MNELLNSTIDYLEKVFAGVATPSKILMCAKQLLNSTSVGLKDMREIVVTMGSVYPAMFNKSETGGIFKILDQSDLN